MRIFEWRRIPVAAILLFAAAACGSTQETQTTDTEGGIGEETAEAAGAVADGAREVADQAEDVIDDEVTVTLSPVAGSSVSGDADLRSSGGSTRVEVELSGLTAGSTYVPEIHSGTCVEAGETVAQLEPVVASGMEAASTSTIDPSVLAAAETEHHIAVNDETGIMVACGELSVEEAGDIR